jgi:carboxyl-terminal processing protease
MSRLARPSAVALAVLVILAAGIWLGGHPSGLPDPVADALVNKQTRVLDEALETVEDNYYVKPKRDTLADNAISGMVDRLRDRFSNYFTPAEYKRMQQQQREEFTGIGVNVRRHRRGLRVVSVFAKSPAKRAGVKTGDIIVRAAGHKLAGMTLQKASSFVAGKAGTTVAITLGRGKRHLNLRITRATLSAGFTTIKFVRRGKEKVGVVRLSQFGPGAHVDLLKALKRLKRRGATRYVLDLRDNPGGLVSEARLVASVFLEDGTIVTTRGRTVKSQTLKATGDALLPEAPLVVLVNRDSASAAEIVAGALQDHKRAEIVGTRTFGKGVFQQVIKLSNGGALDITAGQYFTPSGRNLGGRGTRTGTGLAPDVRASDNSKTKDDEALDRAVAVVAAERGNA